MVRTILYNLIKLLLIITLPFILLIRLAVFLQFNQGLHYSIAITVSAISTAVLLVIYFSIIYGRLTKRRTQIKYLRRRFAIAFFLVGILSVHGIMFVSSENTKSSAVNQEFRSLQPVLRLGCSVLFLLDKNAIITDGSRLPEDYKKMGLKSLRNSLHYKQKDGYAYALDLRTKNRSEIRNSFLKAYFYLMGFRTLRHVGTADHLHISMPCRFSPGAR